MQRVSGNEFFGTSANLPGFYRSDVDVVNLTAAEDYPDALEGAARGATDSAPI